MAEEMAHDMAEDMAEEMAEEKAQQMFKAWVYQYEAANALVKRKRVVKHGGLGSRLLMMILLAQVVEHLLLVVSLLRWQALLP